MDARRGGSYPSLPNLRTVLIPGVDEDQWDTGELPRAVCHLESQSKLRECQVLLQLACVARRSLDETEESRAVALREVLLKLLPRDLDDPCCKVLRVLAGLEAGTAGRGREQRQQIAGSRIGSEHQPATSRTVRRFAKQRCWPWLLDRLIEREVQERKAAIADGANLPQASPATYGRLVPDPADVAWTLAAAQMLWMPEEGWAGDLLLYHVTAALPQPAEEWGRSEDDVKRRTFLLGVPAAFLSSRVRRWQPLWSRLEAATLDVGALDELAGAVARDARLHDRLGSRTVEGLVTEHVRLATELLRESPPPALRPRLAAIASDAAREAGLVFHDQRQFLASQSYHRLATELAREADDPLLVLTRINYTGVI
ncbi:MAG: hypothetical protein QOH66_28 [Actinomycetota bacterium]|nr:hypothetical protein [Actinomycetota bacterium]